MSDQFFGKITRAEFGFGGYDDAMFGLTLTLSGGSSVTDFTGTWATRPASAKWSVEEQREQFADAVELLRDTLRAAKKSHVGQLVGTPVEVTISGGRLSSWRVLTEVIL